MTASDVIRAIKEQNVQVAAGRIGQPPVPAGANVPFQLPINVQGRLVARGAVREHHRQTRCSGAGRPPPRRGARGSTTRRPRDRQGHRTGAKNYDVNSYLDGQPSVTLAVFQLPGSNALATAEAIREKMEELKRSFPEGIEYGSSTTRRCSFRSRSRASTTR